MTSQRAPRGWKKRVKRVLLNVISLGRVCTSVLEAEDVESDDPEVRGSTQVEALRREIRLLNEELALKDARLARVPARKRPHYSPTERMRILELKSARGWSTLQTAGTFLVTPATIASWQRTASIDDTRLVQLREPVNKFPDLIRTAVKRLKILCPRLGKDKIAEMFCRAGVEISASTVSRIVKEPLQPVPPPSPAKPLAVAKKPHDAWVMDLTVVPATGFGYWISWLPHAIPQCWPFCYWVGAIVDMHSRRSLGLAVYRKEPTSARIRAFLKRTANTAGTKPRFLVSDHDPVFNCSLIQKWCGATTDLLLGAVGQKGSIAIVERFFLTFKNEFSRRVFVSLRADAFRTQARYFIEWYNEHRPHAGLDGQTPSDVYEERSAENNRTSGNVLCISFYKGKRHLPVVTTRREAA